MDGAPEATGKERIEADPNAGRCGDARREPETASQGAGSEAPACAFPDDPEPLLAAVVDAANVSATLWFSYLFTLLYIGFAAGGISHRDLLLENPVKLPFLNIDLPLIGFFVLGPALFVTVHAYVMLHFVLLAQKVGVFDGALRTISDEKTRLALRRRLPSNVFAQFLAGPRDVRHGCVGSMLRLITGVSLILAPVALLCLIQLQFLPYHDVVITMWQRVLLVLDLVLIWLLWPSITRGKMIPVRTIRILAQPGLLMATVCSLCLACFIATFPGDPLDRMSSLLAVPWPDENGQWRDYSGRLQWATFHRWLVGGTVDLVARRPSSVWSNRLVLPDFAFEQASKGEGAAPSDDPQPRLSLRGRHLEGAILIGAKLRNVDFSGADLSGAFLNGADVRESKFNFVPISGSILVDPAHRCLENDNGSVSHRCTDLQGAQLTGASLQGAELHGAILRAADLDGAHLQGADLNGAELAAASLVDADLRGASLDGADLRLASFRNARLQIASLRSAHAEGANFAEADLTGAWIDSAWLEGASFERANLQHASMKWISSWRTDILYARSIAGIRMETPLHTEPLTKQAFDALNKKITDATPVLERYDNNPSAFDTELNPDEPLENADLMEEKWLEVFRSSPDRMTYDRSLAQPWRSTACAVDGSPYILRRLIKRLEMHGALDERIPRPEGGDISPLLLSVDCAGAYALSEREKARLRAIGAKSDVVDQR